MEEERSFHDTQPFDDDSLEESSSESSTSMNPVYAKLEPLMDLVPRIEPYVHYGVVARLISGPRPTLNPTL
ncbi:hypothetical protein KIN20_001496 [Parelaphostrongylus tenuis]|uniref:Uncharacterized protein n=1 Tax=Parelaphostrongylus tenuis TaxID=148309 RepID=A0AAD5QEK3_PARTN|nr:hypothetical protein KIN20_001496 [Parelaphostrongylus tenuis]